MCVCRWSTKCATSILSWYILLVFDIGRLFDLCHCCCTFRNQASWVIQSSIHISVCLRTRFVRLRASNAVWIPKRNDAQKGDLKSLFQASPVRKKHNEQKFQKTNLKNSNFLLTLGVWSTSCICEKKNQKNLRKIGFRKTSSIETKCFWDSRNQACRRKAWKAPISFYRLNLLNKRFCVFIHWVYLACASGKDGLLLVIIYYSQLSMEKILISGWGCQGATKGAWEGGD